MAIEDTVKTQGTNIYFVDDTSSTTKVAKMTCPTGITGLMGGATDRINITCLDVVGKFREYVGGMADADALNIPFVLHPKDVSHQTLKDLQDTREVVGWMVCLSESATDPTLDSNDNLVPVPTRTCLAFDAYVSNFTLDVATNEVVRGTLMLQPSGDTTVTWVA